MVLTGPISEVSEVEGYILYTNVMSEVEGYILYTNVADFLTLVSGPLIKYHYVPTLTHMALGWLHNYLRIANDKNIKQLQSCD